MSDYDNGDSGALADDVMSAARVEGLYEDEDGDDSSYAASSSTDDFEEAPLTRADEIVDQLMPEGFEWRRLVCSYPKTAMAISVAAGFLVGRTHGMGLLAGLSGFVLGEVSRNVQEFVEDFGT